MTTCGRQRAPRQEQRRPSAGSSMMARSFPLGHISITPGALAALRQHGIAPETLLDRHSRGDWGDIDPEDQGRHEQAHCSGDRLLSMYPVAEGVRIWVITEAADEDGLRPATTIMLPTDY
jgi:hypothetical protein